MKTNIHFLERVFRLLGGSTLLAWAIAGGPWWAYLGFTFILTGAWGISPLYLFLKLRAEK